MLSAISCFTKRIHIFLAKMSKENGGILSLIQFSVSDIPDSFLKDGRKM